MVKQLIYLATLLLILKNVEAIYYAHSILDFIMLAQYILHNDRTLAYKELV